MSEIICIDPVYATHPHESVTSRYGFVPTYEIINLLEERGWEVMGSEVAKVRRAEYAGYQKHMVRMRHSRAKSLKVLNDTFPEIVITNAHRSGALQILLALFRLACLNGMVLADDMNFQSYRRRHLTGIYDDVLEYIDGVVETIPAITAKVAEFTEVSLQPDEVEEFATEAAKIRWPKRTPVTAVELVRVRRQADVGNDLWTVYNRAQESLLRGGTLGHTKAGKRRLTRGIRSVDETVRINKELWQLTTDTAAKLAA